jgi:hypothetical protein
MAGGGCGSAVVVFANRVIVMNDQANGEIELVFSGATLVLTGTQASFCTLTGTVQAYGEYFGQ